MDRELNHAEIGRILVGQPRRISLECTLGMPLYAAKIEIMLPHYAAPLCCHYADYVAIMPIVPPFNCFIL